MFVLGRDTELSLVELIAYFQKNNFKYEIVKYSEEVAIIKVEKRFEPKKAIKILGGTVKIGEIIKIGNYHYSGWKNKIKYAISAYGDTDVIKINKTLKTIFKEQKLKAFYKKPKRTKALMPSEVIKHNLLEEGVEFLVWGKIIAKTVAVFNPYEHETRDRLMPYKDYKKTISIRLAKILINLSQAKKQILDPFCGYGVLLQEAMIQGIDVLGVDIDKKSVEATKKNLRFIQKKYRLKQKYSIFHGDSRRLFKIVAKVEAIATEPYLGPYLRKDPDFKEALKMMKELEFLYSALLKEARKIVKGKVVIIVPRFPTKQRKEVTMDFDKIVKKIGFKVWKTSLSINIPLIYSHGRIGREIWILE